MEHYVHSITNRNFLYRDYIIGQIHNSIFNSYINYYLLQYSLWVGAIASTASPINYALGRNDGPALIIREPRKSVLEVLDFSRVWSPVQPKSRIITEPRRFRKLPCRVYRESECVGLRSVGNGKHNNCDRIKHALALVFGRS